MNFFKLFLILLFLVFSKSSFADNHSQDEIAQEISEDEEKKQNTLERLLKILYEKNSGT